MTLLENDYLYVDLQSLIDRATKAGATKSAEDTKTGETANDTPGQGTSSDTANLPTKLDDASTHKAWGDVLLSRLAENRKLGNEAKAPDEEIVQSFFTEYYSTLWSAPAAEQLIKIGALLRKDIQISWDRNKNPILAFITQKYVQDNLLETKLLNGETFKAIHNAVAKRLVAQTEFKAKRNYNIIYCRSLYNRTAADMLSYLQMQAAILPATTSKYTIEQQKKNRMTFLKLKSNRGDTVEARADYQTKAGQDLKKLPHTLDKTTVLLDKKTVEKLSGVQLSKEKGATNKAAATNDVVTVLVDKLQDKPAFQYALLQYLSFTADNDTAKAIENYLKDKRFEGLTTDATFKASKAIKATIAKISFNNKSIKALLDGFVAGQEK